MHFDKLHYTHVKKGICIKLSKYFKIKLKVLTTASESKSKINHQNSCLRRIWNFYQNAVYFKEEYLFLYFFNASLPLYCKENNPILNV